MIMGKATQDLRNDHDAIMQVLEIMDKMISQPQEDNIRFQPYDELVYFLRTFADKCHHGKEEEYLFTDLVKHGIPNEGGPVGVMLREHQLGREYIALMDKSLQSQDMPGFYDAAAKYSVLLKKHIEKENNVLFVMADKVLNDTRQDELFRKFEQHEQNVIGHGVHEELHAMINKWSEAVNNNN